MASNLATTDAGQQHQYMSGHDTSGTTGNQYTNDNQYTNGHDSTTRDGVVPARLVKHQGTVSQVNDPTFFKIANPGPLGLISFGVTTFCLGLYQCGAGLPGSNPFGTVGPDQAVFGLAVFFGGMAQFVAGLMEFRVGNTLGCTLHCSYGAFWLSFAMFLVPSLGIQAAYAGNMRAYSFALGIYLIIWCFLTLLFLLAALKTNLAIVATLIFLTLAFFFLSLAQFTLTSHITAARGLNKTGGAMAVLSAVCAIYAGASGFMRPETTWVRFPLGEFNYGNDGPHQSKVSNA